MNSEARFFSFEYRPCFTFSKNPAKVVIRVSLAHFCFVFTCTDEIMQQEIRPLVAVDIIEQLHRQFAILSGKKFLVIIFWDSLGNVLESVILTVVLQFCTAVIIALLDCQ